LTVASEQLAVNYLPAGWLTANTPKKKNGES